MNSDETRSHNLSAIDYHNLFRGRIEHENGLIAQRLSWLVASQSFLFSAYAIVLNGLAGETNAPPSRLAAQQLLLFGLIPIVAVMTAGAIYISIIAAIRSMARFRHIYRSPFGAAANQLPSIQTDPLTRILGLTAPLLLPVLFMVVWMTLWFRSPVS